MYLTKNHILLLIYIIFFVLAILNILILGFICIIVVPSCRIDGFQHFKKRACIRNFCIINTKGLQLKKKEKKFEF